MPEPGKPENIEASNLDEGLVERPAVDTSSLSPVSLPADISQAQREEFAEDHGTYQRTADFRISTTDP